MTFKEARAALSRAGAVFCKPGTERVAALCERLGSPQDHFRAIHVTGTNGKGSTSRMIEGFLRAGGSRTGQFASPYLFPPRSASASTACPFPPVASRILPKGCFPPPRG